MVKLAPISKEKQSAYMKEYRRIHPEYRERQRELLRRFRERNPNYDKEWRKKHRVEIAAQQRKYKKENPEKTKARKRARYLPLDSRCAKCSSTEKLEHHHPDYTQPNLTITLCQQCHQEIHKGVYIHTYGDKAMIRKSKATRAIETAEDGGDREDTFWVIYDFEGSRNPSKFYKNLAVVLGRYDGEPIQKSVIEMKSLRGAKAVEVLAQSYGAKVRWARVEKI